MPNASKKSLAILQRISDFCCRYPYDSAIVAIGFKDLSKHHGQLGFHHYQQIETWIEGGLSCIADGLFERLTPDLFLIGIRNHSQQDLLDHLDQQLDQIQFDAVFTCPWCDLPVHAGVLFPSSMTFSAQEILDAAHKALLAAQGGFTSRTVLYSEELSAIKLPENLIHDVAQAMQSNQLQLFYQPIFTQNNVICGCEALLRWMKPDGTLLSPNEFLPPIEDTHLIRPLGYWVLDAACKQLALLRSKHAAARNWRMFINVSRRQLEPSFVDFVAAMLFKHSLKPSDIELEITESTIAPDHESAIKTLQSLHEMGCSLAIDDFGTGQSTMLSLKYIPARTLKIDRIFTSTMDTSLFSREIVRSTINMAKELGMVTVAEGIEEQHQLTQLLELGCNCWQGYFGSHPLHPSELEKRYLSV